MEDNNKSKTYQIASLGVDGKQVCVNNDISETMNTFFCSIGKNLTDKLSQAANPLLKNTFSVNEHNLQFKFQAVNITHVEKVFWKFKTSLGLARI